MINVLKPNFSDTTVIHTKNKKVLENQQVNKQGDEKKRGSRICCREVNSKILVNNSSQAFFLSQCSTQSWH